MLREKIPLRVLVTSGEQFLQPQMLEVVGKVMKEVADPWIITVAVNDLASEMLFVMPQLVLNIGQLGIELVLLFPRSSP